MNHRLTDNKKTFNGETLYQIECVEDCKYAKRGELGGYIASYNNLADGGWVHKDACVCDTSVVKGCVKSGFVGNKSVVEGKVVGVVINSYISEDSELDFSVIVDSVIKNTKYKAQYSGLVSTLVNITLSKNVNSELIGNIIISKSIIENSIINWNNVEKMNVCNNIAIEDHTNKKTFEKEIIEYGKERVTLINVELKQEWEKGVESLLNSNNIQTNDIEADLLFNENRKERLTNEEDAENLLKETEDIGNYYIKLFGKIYYNQLVELLNRNKITSTVELLEFLKEHKDKRLHFNF